MSSKTIQQGGHQLQQAQGTTCLEKTPPAGKPVWGRHLADKIRAENHPAKVSNTHNQQKEMLLDLQNHPANTSSTQAGMKGLHSSSQFGGSIVSKTLKHLIYEGQPMTLQRRNGFRQGFR